MVTKDRAPATQTPMQESQLSFHRILKEEIEQVHPLASPCPAMVMLRMDVKMKDTKLSRINELNVIQSYYKLFSMQFRGNVCNTLCM